MYKLSIFYPDGHVEEIQESFESLESAKEYGKSMMAQIKNTEAYHAGKKDLFGEKISKKPHFEVSVRENNVTKVVYKGK